MSIHQANDANALCNKTNCTNNSTLSSTSNSTYVPLPILLNSGRTLLNEHDGCTKCRKFYVSHQSHNCPSGFPCRKGYKTLTAADTLAAKRGNTTSTAASSSKSTPKPITATAPSSDEEDDEPSTVTAILPGISDYESDSMEDKDLSIHNVSSP